MNMGIDAGFDMAPRLSPGASDVRAWETFILLVKKTFKDDVKVEFRTDSIVFKAGEHPEIPLDGSKFLRFSSKISGSNASTTGMEDYIRKVYRLAKTHFGFRVHFWTETLDERGVYTWDEVYKSRTVSIAAVEEVQSSENHHSASEIEPNMPLYKVQAIQGRGKGLVASCNIMPGTLIIMEKPLLTAVPAPPHQLEANLATQLRSLSKSEQRQFLALHNSRSRLYPFSGTFRTNALPQGPGSQIGSVYATICLVNHDCTPNANHSWNSEAEHETLYAIRPIQLGDEITISYDRGDDFSARKNFLNESFGFSCTCQKCTSPFDRKVSDALRAEIQRLDETIGDPHNMQRRPGESLQHCRLLLQVLKSEYNGHAGVLNARVYYDAFQISIAHADQARASVFARKAYEIRTICEGRNSPDAQKMKKFASQPTNHASFELCSRRWETAKSMVPKELNKVQFENWLFRD